MYVPIFIIVHDRITVLKQSIESYEKYIKTPIKIILHDVASTYKPCLEYLDEMKYKGYDVYRSDINNHKSVMNTVSIYLEEHLECKYYVITDPDIELDNINGDILELFMYMSDLYPDKPICAACRIDDIPDTYPYKNMLLDNYRIKDVFSDEQIVNYKGNDYKYYNEKTDTTFQLLSRNNLSLKFPRDAVRFVFPYGSKHLDWYLDLNNLMNDQLYYSKHASNIAHWGKNIMFPREYIISIDSQNISDSILPFLYKQISGNNCIFAKAKIHKNNIVYLGSGSQLSHINKWNNVIVWGGGISSSKIKFAKPSGVLLVRGPLTRNQFIKQGYKCPKKYGDIGLLLSKYYKPVIRKKYIFGILLNHDSYLKYSKIFRNIKGIILIDMIVNCVDDVGTIIDQIIKCKNILSETLYGIIISHGYGIRCCWIKFQNNSNNIEYLDYFMSLDIKNIDLNPILITDINKLSRKVKLTKIVNNYWNPEFPINIHHIIKSCPFSNQKVSFTANITNS
jgi:pyruvyltransferase